MPQTGYAASPAYAQTGFFRALVEEVARLWPDLTPEQMVQTLSLDERRYNYMALMHPEMDAARRFADRVLGIQHFIIPNVGCLPPQPQLIGQNRYDFTVFRRAFDGIPPWSQQDMDQSMSEGWIISSQDDGTERIEKYDEDPAGYFSTDSAAQNYVDIKAGMSTDMDCIYNRAVRYVAHSHGNL